MRGLRAWCRWRREMRALRADAFRAHHAWTLARYEYEDMAQIDLSQADQWDRRRELYDEYVRVTRRLRRLEEVGP